MRNPLVRYIAVFWPDHVRGHPETIYRDVLHEFASCQSAVASSTQIYTFIGKEIKDVITRPEAYCGYAVLHTFAKYGLKTIQTVPFTALSLQARTSAGALPIFLATMEGHSEAFEFIISNMKKLNCLASTNVPNNFGFTLLHYAVDGTADIVTWATRVSDHALLDKPASDGFSPLATAAHMGLVDVVRLLLQSGANVNPFWTPETDCKSSSPLWASVCEDHFEVTKLLIHSGAVVSLVSTEGVSLLTRVTNFGSYEHFEFVFNHTPRPIQRDFIGESLLVAAYKQDPRKVKYLLDLGADVNFHKKAGALHLVAMSCKGSLDILRILLDFDVNVNLRTDDASTPLVCAVWHEEQELAIELIKSGACVEALTQDGSSIFDITQNEEGALRIWKDANIENSDYPSALATAAAKGYSKIVTILLDRGYEADLSFKRGENALLWAARYGHANIVVELLKSGADVNAVSAIRSATALHAAATNGHLEVVKILCNKDAKLDLVTLDTGWTPLHEAALTDQFLVVRWLLAIGANPNLRDADPATDSHFTALHIAIFEGHIRSVEELVPHCDLETEVLFCSCTALDLAVTGQREDVVEILLQANAQTGQPCCSKHEFSLLVAMKGNPVIFEALLDRTRSRMLFLGQENQQHTLHYALEQGKLEAVKALLDHGFEIDEWALLCAILSLDETIVELVLNSGFGIGNFGIGVDVTPLACAIGLGSFPIFEKILASGLKEDSLEIGNQRNPAVLKTSNRWCCDAVKAAIQEGRLEMLERLLSIGIPYDASTCVYQATIASEGSTKCLEVLFRHGLDANGLNKDGYNAMRPLHVACENNDRNLVKFLVAHGADMLLKSGLGETPLLIALLLDKVGAAIELVELGLNSDNLEFESWFWTPFKFALYLNREATCTTVLKSMKVSAWVQCCLLVLSNEYWPDNYEDGMIVESGTSDYWAALWIATLLNRAEMLRSMLSHQGILETINIRDELGMTILHWAAAAELDEVVEILLAAGADTDVHDKWRRKPVDLVLASTTYLLLETAKIADASKPQKTASMDGMQYKSDREKNSYA